MYAIALFAFLFAAALGLTMAVLHAKGKKSGMALGIAHGLFALSGIALLAVGLAKVDAGAGWWLVVSFVVVALGGAYLFSRQIRDKPWPGLVIVAHGGLAVLTIIALGVWLYVRDAPPDTTGLETASVTAPAPDAYRAGE